MTIAYRRPRPCLHYLDSTHAGWLLIRMKRAGYTMPAPTEVDMTTSKTMWLNKNKEKITAYISAPPTKDPRSEDRG
jgi:hypothetical protein